MESLQEAIQTTDLWTSYKDEAAKRDHMKTELENWKNATIIRILASTGTKHVRNYVAGLFEKEEKQPETRQLFLLCNKDDTEALFGKFFTHLIDAAKSPAKRENSREQELHSLIETRSGMKRGLAEDVPEREGHRVKKAKVWKADTKYLRLV